LRIATVSLTPNAEEELLALEEEDYQCALTGLLRLETEGAQIGVPTPALSIALDGLAPESRLLKLKTERPARFVFVYFLPEERGTIWVVHLAAVTIM